MEWRSRGISCGKWLQRKDFKAVLELVRSFVMRISSSYMDDKWSALNNVIAEERSLFSLNEVSVREEENQVKFKVRSMLV